MSDADPLIVPVAVQAMVLNGTPTKYGFCRAAMKYDQLPRFGDPTPGAFQNDAGNDFALTPGAQGVYLMWTLPQALRHGQQRPDGTVEFPLVPNRWLVVRLYRPYPAADPAAVPAAAAWMVQSDYLDPSLGTSAYVDPTPDAPFAPMLIGRKVPVTSDAPWREPDGTSRYFLRAVAESNPAFAAYQPFNENVFSLVDDLRTQGLAAGTLSYFVLGWYSQPQQDVLAGWQAGTAGKDFPDLLAALNWTATAGSTARTSLYQGSLFAVPWRPDGSANPSPADGVSPHVALGNTSVDAVTEFARAAFAQVGAPSGLDAETAANLLEAFQYDLLPMLALPGADAMLEQQIRAQWFASAGAGTRWTIVDAQTRPGDTPPPPPTADELAAETKWLGELNDAQAKLDGSTRRLLGVQRELWELWWKKGAATVYASQIGEWPGLAQSEATFDEALAELAKSARALIDGIKTLQPQVPLPTPTVSLPDAIAAFAKGKQLPANRTLKAVAQPRFWAAADPVVVISNTAHMLRIDPDTALSCRWPGERITELGVSAASAGGPAFSVSAAQLASRLPAVTWTGLPAAAPDLFAEFYLLDPANAPLLAAAAGQQLTTEQLAALAASMSPPQPVGGGLVPGVLAPAEWQQPWRPLYLDWEIAWSRLPFRRADHSANWVFNGLDYELAPGIPEAPGTHEFKQGRAVLTPKPAFEFRSRLQRFVADYAQTEAAGKLAAIEDVVEKVDAWDFLSQALGGLHTHLASWSPVAVAKPDATAIGPHGTAAELIGDQAHMPPDAGSFDHIQDPSQITPSTYEGLRAGQFYVNRLSVVDAFGQTLPIVFAPEGNDNLPRIADRSVFTPLVADGLAAKPPIVSDNPGRFVQLPPRLWQPARLNFQFVTTADGNPIEGWILPNHLDSALSVYGADGTGYGELRLGVDAKGNPVVVWNAAPGSPHPTLPTVADAKGALDSFLANLQAGGATAFSNFLLAVDETLWTVDPLGNRADTFLSVLIGRPLALVDATLAYELQSQPWRDPTWPYAFGPRPDPLFVRESYTFPVRLGDLGYRQDGLIGYFLNGDYTAFHAIHMPAPGPGDPPLGQYLKAIGPGNYIDLSFAQGSAAAATMIMDPRGSVHASCGFLPVKEITLPPEWVDSALAKLVLTFRAGPVLAGTQTLVPQGESVPVTSLLLTSPAERKGVWAWVESSAGAWPAMPLAPVDGAARFPPTPPTLREGLLRLTGGLDE